MGILNKAHITTTTMKPMIKKKKVCAFVPIYAKSRREVELGQGHRS